MFRIPSKFVPSPSIGLPFARHLRFVYVSSWRQDRIERHVYEIDTVRLCLTSVSFMSPLCFVYVSVLRFAFRLCLNPRWDCLNDSFRLCLTGGAVRFVYVSFFEGRIGMNPAGIILRGSFRIFLALRPRHLYLLWVGESTRGRGERYRMFLRARRRGQVICLLLSF
jgi:hypothetical protein